MTHDSNQTPTPSEPLRFESPPLGFGDQQQLSQAQKHNNKAVWAIFALLLVLTIGVVFVLPSLVQPPAPPATIAPASPAPSAAQTAPATETAPFAEAQRLRLRQQAQETLAPLLALQETLEKQAVRQWATTLFEQALATAQQGDTAYSAQNYEDALTHYQQALGTLETIDSQHQRIFAEQLAAGHAALTAANSQAAEVAFRIASQLEPTNTEAAQGLERARILDQLLALLTTASTAQQAGKFEEARSNYQTALQLDPGNAEAKVGLAAINTDQANANFNTVMSRGFAALQAGNADAAKVAFEQAGGLRPGAKEVTAALQQAQDQQTLGAINVHINAAQVAEANEDWAQALTAWSSALNIDPNLISAQEGRQRSQSRRNLDQFLVDTLAKPLRLSEQAVYTQTQQVLHDATTLLTPGPKLQKQLQQVQDYLARIKTPVSVNLQSDGLTTVTVYGVGELGQLTSHALSLLPGNYVAVGIRQGYRDVRQEFVVGLDGLAVQLTVACRESL